MSETNNENNNTLKDFTIIMIDNFDSFTYNLVNQLETFAQTVKIFRNDSNVDDIVNLCHEENKKTMLVISPGPGSPKTAGNILKLLQKLRGQCPILGVCLGHQAIIESYGGKIDHAKKVVHGKSHVLDIAPRGKDLFEGITPFSAARYHSLSATEIPNDLEVLATCQNEVMMVSHKKDKVIGLQFHPESILTPNGTELIRRVLINLID